MNSEIQTIKPLSKEKVESIRIEAIEWENRGIDVAGFEMPGEDVIALCNMAKDSLRLRPIIDQLRVALDACDEDTMVKLIQDLNNVYDLQANPRDHRAR